VTYLQMGLPDIVKEYFSTVLMMYVVCLVGFLPGSQDIWLTISCIVYAFQFCLVWPRPSY